MDATVRIALVLFAAVWMGCGAQDNSGKVKGAGANGETCPANIVPNSFLVRWKADVPSEFKRYQLGLESRVTVFRNTSKDWVEKNVLQNHLREYEIAEHNFYLLTSKDRVTVDATGPSTWGPGDIQVNEAWSRLGKKGDGVVVAVIDSGIDYMHPALQSVVWSNPGEIPNNGIDDDRNGFVDDVRGWAFNSGTGDSNNPYDVDSTHSHGSHVSGIIAGKTDFVPNFTGVAPNAKIMPLRFIDSNGEGSVDDAIRAIVYAGKNGAKVINASWGGPGCSDTLNQQIADVVKSGTVFANAAGNEGHNLTSFPDWPAAYRVPGKITVASYNIQQFLSYFSNWGPLVDLAAPGENILSSIQPQGGQTEGQMGVLSGTSMATPFVAGVAALLLSYRPSLSPADVANIVNSNVTVGNFGVRTKGKLNALNAAIAISQ